ncbi:inositol polyphosphate 5-phosphatase [Allomyces arbusculus]|nr:inositol polyphosphate 5-phosphatase [Allomyces arbusculus]
MPSSPAQAPATGAPAVQPATPDRSRQPAPTPTAPSVAPSSSALTSPHSASTHHHHHHHGSPRVTTSPHRGPRHRRSLSASASNSRIHATAASPNHTESRPGSPPQHHRQHAAGVPASSSFYGDALSAHASSWSAASPNNMRIRPILRHPEPAPAPVVSPPLPPQSPSSCHGSLTNLGPSSIGGSATGTQPRSSTASPAPGHAAVPPHPHSAASSPGQHRHRSFQAPPAINSRSPTSSLATRGPRSPVTLHATFVDVIDPRDASRRASMDAAGDMTDDEDGSASPGSYASGSRTPAAMAFHAARLLHGHLHHLHHHPHNPLHHLPFRSHHGDHSAATSDAGHGSDAESAPATPASMPSEHARSPAHSPPLWPAPTIIEEPASARTSIAPTGGTSCDPSTRGSMISASDNWLGLAATSSSPPSVHANSPLQSARPQASLTSRTSQSGLLSRTTSQSAASLMSSSKGSMHTGYRPLRRFESHELEVDQFYIKRYFLIRLSEALTLFGAPSYRIEYLLYTTAETLNLQATFASLPGLFLITLETPPALRLPPPPPPPATSPIHMSSTCSLPYSPPDPRPMSPMGPRPAITAEAVHAIVQSAVLGATTQMEHAIQVQTHAHAATTAMALAQAVPTTETIALPLRQGYNMGRLYLTSQLCLAVARRDLPLEIATDRLDRLLTGTAMGADPPDAGVSDAGVYRAWWWCTPRMYVIANWISSIMISPLAFSGSWWDMLAAGVLGLVVALAQDVTGRFKAMSPVQDALLAFMSGFVGLVLYRAAPAMGERFGYADVTLCYRNIALSALLDQLPGLTLCTAMVELTTSHMILGTTRLMTGLVKALMLAFGLAAGYRVYISVLGDPRAPGGQNSVIFSPCDAKRAVSASPMWPAIAFFLMLVMAVAMTVQMRAAPRQFPIMILAALVAFWVGYVLNYVDISADMSSVINAFAVGLVANLYSRITGHPSIAPMLNGVVMLVPGSMGVRSTLALLDSDEFGAGAVFGFTFILIAFSLSLGILVSRIVPPIDNHLKPSRILAVRRARHAAKVAGGRSRTGRRASSVDRTAPSSPPASARAAHGRAEVKNEPAAAAAAVAAEGRDDAVPEIARTGRTLDRGGGVRADADLLGGSSRSPSPAPAPRAESKPTSGILPGPSISTTLHADSGTLRPLAPPAWRVWWDRASGSMNRSSSTSSSSSSSSSSTSSNDSDATDVAAASTTIGHDGMRACSLPEVALRTFRRPASSPARRSYQSQSSRVLNDSARPVVSSNHDVAILSSAPMRPAAPRARRPESARLPAPIAPHASVDAGLGSGLIARLRRHMPSLASLPRALGSIVHLVEPETQPEPPPPPPPPPTGPLRVFVGTWNMHGSLPAELAPFVPAIDEDPAAFEAGAAQVRGSPIKTTPGIPSAPETSGPDAENILSPTADPKPRIGHPYHLIVLGTQECQKSISESVVFPSKAEWERQLLDTFGQHYDMVACQTMAALHLCILVWNKCTHLVSNVQASCVPTGIGGVVGNKGGVGIALSFGSRSMVFVNVHLTAHQDNVHLRNADYFRIERLLYFPNYVDHIESSELLDDEDGFLASSFFDYAFFLGDTNYRINGTGPLVTHLIATHRLDACLNNDQLTAQRRAGHTFLGFSEAPITFAPTFKIKVTHAHARRPSSDAGDSTSLSADGSKSLSRRTHQLARSLSRSIRRRSVSPSAVGQVSADAMSTPVVSSAALDTSALAMGPAGPTSSPAPPASRTLQVPGQVADKDADVPLSPSAPRKESPGNVAATLARRRVIKYGSAIELSTPPQSTAFLGDALASAGSTSGTSPVPTLTRFPRPSISVSTGSVAPTGPVVVTSTSDQTADGPRPYNAHRIPAWTDRILFKARVRPQPPPDSPSGSITQLLRVGLRPVRASDVRRTESGRLTSSVSLGAQEEAEIVDHDRRNTAVIKCVEYTSVPSQPGSDHYPVVGVFDCQFDWNVEDPAAGVVPDPPAVVAATQPSSQPTVLRASPPKRVSVRQPKIVPATVEPESASSDSPVTPVPPAPPAVVTTARVSPRRKSVAPSRMVAGTASRRSANGTRTLDRRADRRCLLM